MSESMLARLFEHNNWANLKLIEACADLGVERLDAKPDPASTWSVRRALCHLVESQLGYLSLLTVPPESRRAARTTFVELEASARTSGEALLALAHGEDGTRPTTRLRTMDGYFVEPWVVMLQAINHATDHRRQISGLLRSLGVTPPTLDGWAYGESVEALVPTST